jgi:hypothetical protein
MDDQPDIPDDYADLVDAMVDTNSGRVLPKSPSGKLSFLGRNTGDRQTRT